MPGSAQPRYKSGPQPWVGYHRVPQDSHGALSQSLWTRTADKPDLSAAPSEPTLSLNKFSQGKQELERRVGVGLWERGTRDASWKDLPEEVVTARCDRRGTPESARDGERRPRSQSMGRPMQGEGERPGPITGGPCRPRGGLWTPLRAVRNLHLGAGRGRCSHVGCQEKEGARKPVGSNISGTPLAPRPCCAWWSSSVLSSSDTFDQTSSFA